MSQSVVIETTHPTYSYRAADFTPAATPTDVLALVGATGKCIRITKIGISGSATAAALLDVYITKRTTLNTGGTSSSPVATKYDSLDGAPSGTLLLYTANASGLGTGTGLEGDKIYLAVQGTPTSAPSHWMVDYTGLESKCPILRNASESISINFAGATLAAGTSLYLYIEWTEEAGV
jgi:hypothetical protein